MKHIVVDSRIFEFPDSWLVVKYDDLPYYQEKLRCRASGSKGWKREMKGVDLIAMDMSAKEPVMFLIESKDYRVYRRGKSMSPAEEFVQKVLDTLTGILPVILSNSSRTREEEALAMQVRKARHLRLVYQFEQPAKQSKLFPRAFDSADMQMEIRRELKAVDPHACVIEASLQHRVCWNVR